MTAEYENDFEYDFESRIVSSSFSEAEDSENEPTLRPRTLDEYIGQVKAKENLKIYIDAALSRIE